MIIKWYWAVLGLVALLILALLSRNNRDVARLEQARDSLRSEIAAYRADSIVWAAIDSARQDTVRTGLATAASASRRALRSRLRVDSLEAVIARFDSVVPLATVEFALAEMDSVITAQDTQIEALNLVVTTQTSMLTQRDSVIAILHRWAHEATDQAERWRKIAKPPLFSLQRPRLRPVVGCGVSLGGGGACVAGFGVSF